MIKMTYFQCLNHFYDKNTKNMTKFLVTLLLLQWEAEIKPIFCGGFLQFPKRVPPIFYVPNFEGIEVCACSAINTLWQV